MQHSASIRITSCSLHRIRGRAGKWTWKRDPTSVMVIDLGSQAEAVASHVRGWTKGQFLAWLSAFGEVLKIRDEGDTEHYSFRSRAGVWTGFLFTGGGDLALPVTVGGSIRRVILVSMSDSDPRAEL